MLHLKLAGLFRYVWSFSGHNTRQKQLPVRKGVLRKFAKCTGKHLCHSPATLLKKRLWHRCFPVKFAKFLRAHFYRTVFGQVTQRKIVPQTIVPEDNCPRGKLSPDKCPPENYPRGKLPPGQLPPRWLLLDKCPKDNYNYPLTTSHWILPPRKIFFRMICCLHSCPAENCHTRTFSQG